MKCGRIALFLMGTSSLWGCTNPSDVSPSFHPGFSIAPVIDPVTLPIRSAGGETITLTGKFFSGLTTSVRIDGQPCGSVNVLTSQMLTCVTPPNPMGPNDARMVTVEGLNSDLGSTGLLTQRIYYIGSPATWLDASDNSTLLNGVTPVVAGQKIQTWKDKSGNARNFSQAVSGNQPYWSVAGLNSHPSVTFSGFQWLDVSLAQLAINFATDPVTTLIVFNAPSISWYTLFSTLNFQNAANVFRILGGGFFGTSFVGGQTYIQTMTLDADINIYKNGGLMSSAVGYSRVAGPGGGGCGGLAGNFFRLGADGVSGQGCQDIFAGNIAELFIYPTSFNSSQRAAVEAYLNAKYSIY